MKTLGWFLGMSGVLAVANWFGGWQVSLLVGLVFGLLYPLKRAVWMSFLSGVIGWGGPLVVVVVSGEAVKLAELVGKMMALGNAGTTVVLLLPCIVGGLLTLFSAWIVGAIRTLFVITEVRSNVPVATGETAVDM